MAEHRIPAEKWNSDKNGEHVSDFAKADAREPTTPIGEEPSDRVTASLHGPNGHCHRRFPKQGTFGNKSDMQLLAVGISGTPHGPLKFNAFYHNGDEVYIYRQNTAAECECSGKFLDFTVESWAERQTAVLWFDSGRVEVTDGE